jgi:hypothetical protein
MTEPRFEPRVEPRFETVDSAALEDLLRRPDLPMAERRAIQYELGRRIAGNISGAPATPAPPPSPPVGTPAAQFAAPFGTPPHASTPVPSAPLASPGSAAQSAPTPPASPPRGSTAPSASAPPVSPPRGPSGPSVPYVPAGPPPRGPYPPAQPRPSRRSAAGAIVGVLVVLAAAVGALLYFLNGSDEPTPPSDGTTCYATAGPCPLAAAAPIGSPCTCVDSAGVAYSGTVG